MDSQGSISHCLLVEGGFWRSQIPTSSCFFRQILLDITNGRKGITLRIKTFASSLFNSSIAKFLVVGHPGDKDEKIGKHSTVVLAKGYDNDTES